jgi:hypothetical protein
MAWERSIARARAAGGSEESLLLLLKGFKSSRTLDAWVDGCVEEAGGIVGMLALLRASVDESAFDLASWLAAFEGVQVYLASRGRSASVSSVLGYLQCSAEFGGSGENRQSLPEIIDGMLEQFGFEGQEGCGLG